MSALIDRLRAALAGRYAIEEEIGAGGMATVYLAEDLRHHRKVAVKVLRSELASTMGPERFLREIEIAAQLQHPHVLPLYDSGEARGFLYYVMPFVEGESLRTRIDRAGELPVGEAVRILRDVADALAYAHERGVVHRDVKPANVLLSGRHALVTDFGVAKAVSEATGRQHLTTAGVALGTPAYMAPEQAAADPHIDQRADIYALGVLAYELLAGSPPFTGRTAAQVLSAHVTEAPAPVTEHRTAVPPALAELVMRCLEKKPADRWQSAQDLLPQLEALTTPSGGMTPIETRPVRAVSKRTRWQPLTLVGVGGILVLAAAVFLLQGRGEGPLANDRVLVGVFANETGDPARDAVGKIVADWLTRGLHETGLVEVLDERSVGAEPVPGGATPVELRSLAQEAGAGLIVSGSYYLTGDSLELQGQILDARDGSVVRALGPMTASADQPQSAARELRERMMGAFANILDPRFGAVAPGSSPPSYEAYQAFVAGDELFYQSRYPESAERLMGAYRLDSTFAVAAVRAAVAWQNAGRCDTVDSIARVLGPERPRIAPYDRYYLDRIVARCHADYAAHLDAAEEMMRAAPASPFARYVAGRSALWVNRVRYGLDLLEAIDPLRGEMRQTYHQLERDIATAHHQLGDYEGEQAVVEAWQGRDETRAGPIAQVRVLAGLGRWDEARAAAEQSASLSFAASPFWASDIVCIMATEVRAHGGPDVSLAAREECLDAVERASPADGDSIPYLTRLGDALFRLDRLDEASAVYEDVLRLSPETSPSGAPSDLQAMGRLGVIAVQRGDEEGAARWDARLSAYESDYVGGRPTLWRANMAVAAGERDRAIGLLRQAFNQGLSFWTTSYGDAFHVQVELEPLFGDPAYREMVAPRE